MCKYPLIGIRAVDPDTGVIRYKVLGSKKKVPDLFKMDPRKFTDGRYILLPCGQCMECRINKAREWSVRLVHESKMHERSSFLTLTYNEDNLPAGNSLYYPDVQKFLKMLRRHLDLKFGEKVRFYCVGEYGSLSFRPHYHMLLFGEDFSYDRLLWKVSGNGDRYFRSPSLESLWPHGYSVIGSVTYDSVFYCAKYVTKKIKGDIAEFEYAGVEPEKAWMSRRPGIGHDFMQKYTGDIYNHDVVDMGKFKLRPPKYYDKLFSVCHPFEYDLIQEKRRSETKARVNKLVEDRMLTGGKFDPAKAVEYYEVKDYLAKDHIVHKKGFEKL